VLVFVGLAMPACGDDEAASDGTSSESTGDMPTGGVAESSTGAGESGEEETEAPAVSGEELFKSICAPCHGFEGEGTALAYELRHPHRGHATWVIRNGRPGPEFPDTAMAAYSPDVVSDVQLEEIFDYLDSFPQPTTGEDLYLDYCRNCHGADPRTGGVVDKNPLDEPADSVLEEVRDGSGGNDYGNRHEYMPAFSSARLSDAEVQAIVDWMTGLE
jgi:mono/diheme cytochrome c family protein